MICIRHTIHAKVILLDRRYNVSSWACQAVGALWIEVALIEYQ